MERVKGKLKKAQRKAGGIDRKAWGKAWAGEDVDEEWVGQAFEVLDMYGTEWVDAKEFFIYTALTAYTSADHMVDYCFRAYDKSGDGTLDAEELAGLMMAVVRTAKRLRFALPGFKGTLVAIESDESSASESDDGRSAKGKSKKGKAKAKSKKGKAKPRMGVPDFNLTRREQARVEALADELFLDLDEDNNGAVDYKEFAAAKTESKLVMRALTYFLTIATALPAPGSDADSGSGSGKKKKAKKAKKTKKTKKTKSKSKTKTKSKSKKAKAASGSGSGSGSGSDAGEGAGSGSGSGEGAGEGETKSKKKRRRKKKRVGGDGSGDGNSGNSGDGGAGAGASKKKRRRKKTTATKKRRRRTKK